MQRRITSNNDRIVSIAKCRRLSDNNVMSVQRVKRLQMAFDFQKTELPPPELPEGCFFVPWAPELVEVHADVKYRGFRNDSDALIFFSNIRKKIVSILMMMKYSTAVAKSGMMDSVRLTMI